MNGYLIVFGNRIKKEQNFEFNKRNILIFRAMPLVIEIKSCLFEFNMLNIVVLYVKHMKIRQVKSIVY